MDGVGRSILPQAGYRWIHRGLRHFFPDCLWQADPGAGGNAVYLTFDDGPHPTYTPQLLHLLADFQVSASFFLLGERVERWPEVAAAIATQGHHIGLHGFQHLEFPRLSDLQLQTTLARTQEAVRRACGSVAGDVRPPNGVFLPHTLSCLRAWGYRPVMWSVVPEDWTLPPVEEVVRRILDQIYPGALIVLHDGPCGGQQVVETVNALLPLLQARGFRVEPLTDPDPVSHQRPSRGF